MNSINIITPPDFVYNNNKSLLFICPSNYITQQLTILLEEVENNANIYFYTDEFDYKWLLSIFKAVDHVIIDLDHCSPIVKNLASYFIGDSKTYYLTNDNQTPYNMISANRVYSIDIVKKLIEE
jgi:hypothetical protein